MAFLGPDVFRDSNPARCTRCNNRGNVGDWLRIAFLREQVVDLGLDKEWLHIQFPDQVAAELGTTSEVTGRTPSMVAGGVRKALADLRTKLAAVEAQLGELVAAGDQVADALRDIAGAGHLVYLDAWDRAAAERQGGGAGG